MECKPGVRSRRLWNGWMLLALFALPGLGHADSIIVLPTALPDPTVGISYSQTLTVLGGTAPYTFSVSSGALPAGITLSGDGTLSGTPTAGGHFNFKIDVTDDDGNAGEGNYHWEVSPPTITVSPAALPAATYGAAYSQSLTASGGTGSYSFTISAGSLPADLNLSSTGTLSGTPAAAGSFTFTVQATDSSTGDGPYTGSRSYTLEVSGPTLTLAPPGGTLSADYGQPFSQTFTASGSAGPFDYDLSGSLPNGLNWSAGGHTISGTPTQAGNFPVAVTATDSGSGASVTQNYTIRVSAPDIVVAPSSLPSGKVGRGYSATLTASGGSGSYRFSVTSGALPAGLTLSGGGGLSGTPTAAGSFSFKVTATDSNGQSGSRGYNLDIAGASLSLSPANLPTATPGEAYSEKVTASGGTAPYRYAITAGSLPSGLALNGSTGVLAGTPGKSGSFTFTVTATDSSTGSGAPFTVSRSYTLTVSTVNITVSPASLPAMEVGAAVSQQFSASGGSGGYTFSITSGKLPPGLSLSSAGSLSGTPTSAGSFTFTVTARDKNGSTGTRTYDVSVGQTQAAPVAKSQKVSVLAGKTVTVDATQGATGGPFTGAAVSSPPATGTATVKGTDIVYSAPADASGTVTFEYTLSNDTGTSQPAQVTVTINPAPIAPSLSAKVPAGATVRIDLTKNASGGPFTGASIVSVDPSGAGTATVQATDSGFALDFSAAGNFIGEAQLTYTLSNAYATSDPGTIRITVTGTRPDPSRDAEVLGVLAAQASATRRMAQGQIDNFQQRLETLHDRATMTGFTNGITFSSAAQARARNLRKRDARWHPAQDLDRQRYLVQPRPASAAAVDDGTDGSGFDGNGGSALPDGLSVWTAGAVNFGNSPESGSGIDFTTTGVTVGADQRMGDAFTLGAGLGYGHDTTDVGDNGSRSTADSYNLAVYGSYHPRDSLYVDGLVGYQWLSLDARRYVTADGGLVHGSRDGQQWFGSLAIGYEDRTTNLLLVPYARLDVARARLDAYDEKGDAVYALAYERQDVDTTTGNLGVRIQLNYKESYGVWMPGVRVEYRHDFQDSSSAAIRYFDLSNGPVYHASAPDQSRNHLLVGAGIQFQTYSWSLRFEYRNLSDNSDGDNQSILLSFGMPLP